MGAFACKRTSIGEETSVCVCVREREREREIDREREREAFEMPRLNLEKELGSLTLSFRGT